MAKEREPERIHDRCLATDAIGEYVPQTFRAAESRLSAHSVSATKVSHIAEDHEIAA
jgi:hypothetical protein